MKYITFLLLFISQLSYCQVKNLYPLSIDTLGLSVEGEERYEEDAEIFMQVQTGIDSNGDSLVITDAMRKIAYNFNPTADNYWDIIGCGCSWYCGGGPYKVSGSSCLKPQSNIDYEADNIHDLNYKDVWVEGVQGYGVGEYVTYTFKADSPRVTEIKVVNGYVKSESAYRNNSRVKTLKVYFNDEPYAILHLKDFRSIQSFKVDTLGYGYKEGKGKTDWTLKFEIIEVYKGDKCDDTVISEIFFDGTDVHCFAKGTKVTMYDNTEKNIEDLQVGDSIYTLELKMCKKQLAIVKKLEAVKHHHLVTYHFESGLTITATPDHPFMLAKGWGSLNPEASANYQGFENIRTIKVGDNFSGLNRREKLVRIEHHHEEQETYTISDISYGRIFYANGLAVGVERLK